VACSKVNFTQGQHGDLESLPRRPYGRKDRRKAGSKHVVAVALVFADCNLRVQFVHCTVDVLEC
jgi:hypothetical protein